MHDAQTGQVDLFVGTLAHPGQRPRTRRSSGPPTSNPSSCGLLGGDAAGFPNGRRVFDDVVAIELRAIAGVTYALVDQTYTPDAAASQLTAGLTPDSLNVPYLTSFPYLGVPVRPLRPCSETGGSRRE